MIENKNKEIERAQTHIRIHNKSGFVLAMDMDIPCGDVITNLVNLMSDGE